MIGARRLWGAPLIATCCGAVAADQVTYFHTDAQGSVVALSDENGEIIERRYYEPYGAVVHAPVEGPGYTGHVHDGATGLVYMQQRYYDAVLGIMVSADPVATLQAPVVGFNRYRYANSNPYSFTDPDGRMGCAASRIKAVCQSVGMSVSTSLRSAHDTGNLSRVASVDPAPNVVPRPGVEIRSEQLLWDLQALSNSVGRRDIDVISGYRSAERQQGLRNEKKNVRAARRSQHTFGIAADIKIPGMSQKDVGISAYKTGRFERVNVYADPAAGVHIDYQDVGPGTQMYKQWSRVKGDE